MFQGSGVVIGLTAVAAVLFFPPLTHLMLTEQHGCAVTKLVLKML